MMAANMTPPSDAPKKSSLTKKEGKVLEKITAASSAPWLKPELSESQIYDLDGLSHSLPVWSSSSAAKPDLKSLQTLSECLKLLHKLADEVNNISQGKRGGKRTAAAAGGSREPSSLEGSRTLILHWAKELKLHMEKKESTPKKRDMKKTDEDKLSKRLQEWAVELRDATEANGVSDEELKKLLYPDGAKKSRMTAILPLLEFVTWSMLAEDTDEAVSRIWLPTKQKAWRTGGGNPKYIPNSVWCWIQSAAVPLHFDTSSCHPWLSVSSDGLQLQELPQKELLLPSPSDSSRGSSEQPFVLGDAVISAGRHYWEVEASPRGSWRIGVISVSTLKKKGSSMSLQKGTWTVWKASSFWACTDPATELQRAAVPGQIGVYVDVEEGQVSFYDVERRVHIYTFSDTFKHGLVPVFGWLDGAVLRIKPVSHC